MLVLTEDQIRELVGAHDARTAMAEAFLALHRGAATIANVVSLPFVSPDGVAHIKAGHIHEDAVWTTKISADFYPAERATTHSGLMLVLSSVDGTLAAVLLDNGYLTELRTGGAGAVAADLLARENVRTVAIIGAGSQARYQLEALRQVRPIEEVRVASRTRERAEAFAAEVVDLYATRAAVHTSVRDAVAGADVIVTATPSSEPLIDASMLEPGMHITAVGSDEPTKQELAAEVLERADLVAVDDRGQAARMGELHHAIEAGLRTEGDAATLGELLDGTSGRTRDEDVTVADLTGVGVQDAAIAALVLRRAIAAESERLSRDGDGQESVATKGIVASS